MRVKVLLFNRSIFELKKLKFHKLNTSSFKADSLFSNLYINF